MTADAKNGSPPFAGEPGLTLNFGRRRMKRAGIVLTPIVLAAKAATKEEEDKSSRMKRIGED